MNMYSEGVYVNDVNLSLHTCSLITSGLVFCINNRSWAPASVACTVPFLTAPVGQTLFARDCGRVLAE